MGRLGRSRSAWASAAAMAAILCASRPAFAVPLGAPSPADPAAAKAEAVAHFDKGIVLYDQGAWSAALAEFVEARRLYPLRNALYQAGLCLEKLQQYDEALERFEATLREYGETMPVEIKESVQRKVVEMRAVVGEIVVDEAVPGATVSVDGLARGEYPLLSPLRVAAGAHVVRVYRPGFQLFEARVIVAGGKTERVPARLSPLGPSGRAGIAEQGGRVLDVLIDGARVGKTPWQGALGPGAHLVVLRGDGHLGTPPAQIVVEVDRTTSLTLVAEELDAALRVEPVPMNAGVAIDGMSVGRGVWYGRLRGGEHDVEVAAPGFLAAVRRIDLGKAGDRVVRLALERDERSPFWRKPPRKPRFVVEATSSAVVLPSFAGDVAGTCVQTCRGAPGVGGAAFIHAGYELGSRLGFGVAAGYLAAAQSVSGRSTSVKPIGLAPNAGTVDDRLALRGGMAGAWLGYTLGARAPLRFRLGAGAVVGSLLDERTNGSFATNEGTPYRLGPVLERHGAAFFYAAPEIRVSLPLTPRVELNAGLAVPVLVAVRQPHWDADHDVPAGKDGVGTFAADTLTGSVVVVLAPGIGVRYDL